MFPVSLLLCAEFWGILSAFISQLLTLYSAVDHFDVGIRGPRTQRGYRRVSQESLAVRRIGINCEPARGENRAY